MDAHAGRRHPPLTIWRASAHAPDRGEVEACHLGFWFQDLRRADLLL